jgi:hypothetical protein
VLISKAEHLSWKGQREKSKEKLFEIDYLVRKILLIKCLPKILGRIVDEIVVLFVVGISLGDCDEVGPSFEICGEELAKISQKVLVDDLVPKRALVQPMESESFC